MAIRPTFVPTTDGPQLVEEILFYFPWAPGFAEVQKKMNILALHNAARRRGFHSILEISTKSDEEIGKRLSAFSLKVSIGNKKCPLESVYQGSEVFEGAGPFPEVLSMQPRDAKRFIRGLDLGKMIGF